MIIDFGEWPLWAGALLIFSARVADVSLGTLRIAFISKGEKSLAPLIGFVEMLIWLVAISQIMQNLNNAAYYLAYAGGFSTGIFCGLRLEERIALGSRFVRTVTGLDVHDLIDALRAAGFGVTAVGAEGHSGQVKILFSVVKRPDVPHYMAIVAKHHPEAFSTVEEVRSVERGVFRAGTGRLPLRKGK
jgi:uncharacterized protein YebE (UPF0316 family)